MTCVEGCICGGTCHGCSGNLALATLVLGEAYLHQLRWRASSSAKVVAFDVDFGVIHVTGSKRLLSDVALSLGPLTF